MSENRGFDNSVGKEKCWVNKCDNLSSIPDPIRKATKSHPIRNPPFKEGRVRTILSLSGYPHLLYCQSPDHENPISKYDTIKCFLNFLSGLLVHSSRHAHVSTIKHPYCYMCACTHTHRHTSNSKV